MRCSMLIPSVLLVFLLAIFNVTVAEHVNNMLTSDNLEDQIVRSYFEKRAATATHDTATATNDTTAGASTAKPAKKAKAPASLASPAVLQDGTLFYIGTAVTCLLWVTGKVIDVKMERQEKYAESLIHSI
ncbi:hypothetical protein BDF21DRAFT_461621 [Thamnidium elegans]|uniref:Uncharacterized protein n=1 Tax=Thamnidium elegans TaxID=101142 RepID=A0A8H7W0V5_9FUNG|nr:hypothetical protein INT48_007236 [Thamnidium elegans]KAI8085720.1 hypothetical protein BDF21DRAFT_461621 [Thamnidium elegans]